VQAGPPRLRAGIIQALKDRFPPEGGYRACAECGERSGPGKKNSQVIFCPGPVSKTGPFFLKQGPRA